MGLKYVFLATEGAHDQAAVGRLLKLLGLKEFEGEIKLLDPFWTPLIPTYPKGGKLYVRLDMPSIYTSSTHSVAIYQGSGSDLTKNLRAIMAAFPQYARDIDAFGLIVDADTKQPDQVAKKYTQSLREFLPAISDVPGMVTSTKPRTGIYVLPDNKQSGVLDSVLVSCASLVYPEHKAGAEKYLDGLSSVHKSHWRPFSKQKALVASIVSVLRPGMANTPSIAQDNWFSEQTINDIPEASMLKQFLETLLDLPISEDESAS